MLIQGDIFTKIKEIEKESIQCIVTSPPYWQQRDYNVSGQLGQEELPEQYVNKMVKILVELHRVLKHEGSLWFNIGDSKLQKDFGIYKKGNLACIPWHIILKAQQIGWYLIQTIIWHKTNAMPMSLKNRCVPSFEYIFHLTKSLDYYYNHLSIQEETKWGGTGGKFGGNKYRNDGTYSGKVYVNSGKANKRDVWSIATGSKGLHCAPFPEEIPRICILATSKENDIVLDPFVGSGTTYYIAKSLNRQAIGIDLTMEHIISRGSN